MASAKHNKPKAPAARVTPITREGVSQAADLSPEGSEAHYKRLGGPGRRRKNPDRFDRIGRERKQGVQ